MRTEKTQAFVLRRFPHDGRQDLRTSLFTQKYGKIYATAKGALSTRSRRAGALDSVNIINCMLSEHHGSHYIQSIELLSMLSGIKGDMGKITMLLLAFDVLDTLLPLEQPEPQTYEQVKRLVYDIDRTNEPRKLTMEWIQNAVTSLGYPPMKHVHTIAELLVSIEELTERPFAAPWQFVIE